MSVEFVASAANPSQFPHDRLPEVAFVGRSNVGKSSLLNTLVRYGPKGSGPIGRKDLAFVSSTPGRTQTVNFYRVQGRFYFVDLPGYGFAKAPRAVVNEWKALAEGYLIGREPLRLVVVIVDSRHEPKALDVQMRDWLEAEGTPYLVVASKVDKLKKTRLAESLRAIEETFHPPVAFSAVTGEGASVLWERIRTAVDR